METEWYRLGNLSLTIQRLIRANNDGCAVFYFDYLAHYLGKERGCNEELTRTVCLSPPAI